MPSPCSAESGIGSPRPSAYASLMPDIAGAALDLVRGQHDRLVRAPQQRREAFHPAAVTPTRASIRKRITSASRIAISVCARMRASSDASVASSKPAVSISVKSRSPSRPCASRRSRVTPGVSSTMASFLPASRLNSVDLPTFGRPTIASLHAVSGNRRGASVQAPARAY